MLSLRALISQKVGLTSLIIINLGYWYNFRSS